MSDPLYNQFHNQPVSINLDYILKNENKINVEVVKNHLKYNKYKYFINMNKFNEPSLVDIASTLTNVAETGVKVFDTFLTNLAPQVEKVINTVLTETNSKSNSNGKSDRNDKTRCSNTPYFYKETDSEILISCEIPRVEKKNCIIKLDSNNILLINAITSVSSEMPDFSFMEQRDYEFEITLTSNITSNMINAKIIDGVLYIVITKKLINIDEINIL